MERKIYGAEAEYIKIVGQAAFERVLEDKYSVQQIIEFARERFDDDWAEVAVKMIFWAAFEKARQKSLK